MDESIFIGRRKSYIEVDKIYFWTATINNWQRLLQSDVFKDVVINSLAYLSDKGKLDVFAFVIMPNHIHLIWRINEVNGRESSNASFLKYTAHEFKKLLAPADLSKFKVNRINKQYEFWKRDSLAIELYSEHIAFQKLDYIHNNPTAERWQLADEPCDYKYSSARFYEGDEEDKREFYFLKDLREEF